MMMTVVFIEGFVRGILGIAKREELIAGDPPQREQIRPLIPLPPSKNRTSRASPGSAKRSQEAPPNVSDVRAKRQARRGKRRRRAA